MQLVDRLDELAPVTKEALKAQDDLQKAVAVLEDYELLVRYAEKRVRRLQDDYTAALINQETGSLPW